MPPSSAPPASAGGTPPRSAGGDGHEPPGKVVGNRGAPDPLRVDRSPEERWRRRLDHHFALRVRRGVYRFRTHEEADQWLLDHQIRRPTP